MAEGKFYLRTEQIFFRKTCRFGQVGKFSIIQHMSHFGNILEFKVMYCCFLYALISRQRVCKMYLQLYIHNVGMSI